jgi:serine/threonine protein kinase
MIKQKTRKNSCKRNSSKKTKKGGVVVGHGTYGCVIRPNIACGNYVSSDKYVSKLINKSAIADEIDIINILGINKIPNAEKHFVIPLSYCDANTLNFIETLNKHPQIKDIEECMQIKPAELSKLEDIVNVIQPYGGIEFLKYRNSHLKEFFIYLLPYYNQLFEAVIELNKIGVIHRDIKHSNIVIDEKEGNLKLIDFGLSCFSSDYLNSQNFNNMVIFDENTYRNGYYIWPVELYVFHNFYNDPYTIYTLDEEVINNNLEQYKSQWIPKGIHDKYKVNYFKMCESINRKVRTIMSITDKNKRYQEIYNWKKESNNKFDVFSVGSVLMYEMKLLFRNTNNNNKKYYHDLLDFIIMRMLNMYSYERYDINMAYLQFTELCNEILQLELHE